MDVYFHDKKDAQIIHLKTINRMNGTLLYWLWTSTPTPQKAGNQFSKNFHRAKIYYETEKSELYTDVMEM